METRNMRQDLEQIMLEHHNKSILETAPFVHQYLGTFQEVPKEISSWIKTLVQAEAEEAWMAKKWGYITAATGVGKSKMAINILEKCVKIFLAKGEVPKVLLVVPTENLRDSNWPDEFKKWGAEWLLEYVTAICYKSLHTLSGDTYHLVVLDEWHNITELNSTFFWQNQVKALLALSATKPRDLIKLQIATKLYLTEVYKVPLDTAVKLHLVTPYEITVITMPLDNVDKYVPFGPKGAPYRATEVKRYTYLSDQIDGIKASLKGFRKVVDPLTGDVSTVMVPMPTNPARVRGMLKNLALGRMRLIYNLKSKAKVAKAILDSMPEGERVLTFCGSIEHADALAKNGQTFHSKLKGKDKDKWLKAFKAQEIDEITCVNSLNEGQNIDNVDTALIVQLNSNELHTIQRIGRTLRYRPGHTAQVIILCAQDTQDEIWVKEALSSLESENIRWISWNGHQGQVVSEVHSESVATP